MSELCILAGCLLAVATMAFPSMAVGGGGVGPDMSQCTRLAQSGELCGKAKTITNQTAIRATSA